MTSNSDTDLQLLNGILNNCSGTLAGLVFTKTGVVYQKKTIIKKDSIIREKRR